METPALDLPIAPNAPGFEADIERVFRLQQAHHPAVRRTTAKERRDKLKRLRAYILSRREDIQAALYADFRKSPEEVDLTEIVAVLAEIKDARDHLKRWMRPRKLKNNLLYLGTTSHVHVEPKGVALIISPWNYSFSLTFAPLVSAIAAGCCVVLKPSEYTPHISGLMKQMVDDFFDEGEVALFEGNHEVSQALLTQPFNHIFFTGSPGVGKIVMAAAAKHLASVTLELGGKSPTIVDETANVDAAAKKIAWGKFTNGAQTCIAPDYVYVHAKQYDAFLAALKSHIDAMYGETPPARKASPAYTRAVNGRHWERVKDILDDALTHGATLLTGGEVSEGDNYLAPTVVTDVDPESRIMQEEIFGPVMPILKYDDLDEVLQVINSKEKPLTLYIFSDSKATTERILRETSAGSTCINDTLIHYVNTEIPFGGVNNSGIGKSHGYAGFLAFSNERGVLKQHMNYTLNQQFYPPFTPTTRKLIDALLKYF